MKINSINCQTRSTVFGYNLPEYCNYKKSFSTASFINQVCQKKRAQGQAVYERYIQALENFKNKRFNATPLYNLYKPQIDKLSKWEKLFFNDYIKDLKPPIYEVMEKEQVTREIKTPFRNFLNFMFGKPERNKQVTETVEKPE